MAQRVNTALREAVLDSPVSRFGERIATLAALVVAVPLSTGRIERYGRLIVCRGLPSWAFGRGGTCIGRVYLTRDRVDAATLRHELVHVRQWRRYGLLFPLLYFASGLDATRNRFEIEAGLADGGYANPAGTR